MKNTLVLSNLYEAFARRDVQAIMKFIDESIIVTQTDLLPWATSFTVITVCKCFSENCLPILIRKLSRRNLSKPETASSFSAERAARSEKVENRSTFESVTFGKFATDVRRALRLTLTRH